MTLPFSDFTKPDFRERFFECSNAEAVICVAGICTVVVLTPCPADDALGPIAIKRCCTAAAKKAARKGINSLRKQIAAHRKKLAEYIKDPDKFDNLGKLPGVDPATRAKIIAGRIAKLQKEIAKFGKEIQKLLDLLKNCL